MSYFFYFLMTIFYFIFIFLYPNLIKTTTLNSIETFVKILIPSILPSYILSNILIENPFFNKLTNKLSFLFNVFDSSKSISIFITNILIGSPTTIINCVKNYSNKYISKEDFKILLKSSSFINPLFIINITKTLNIQSYITTYIIIINILINYIILITHKKKKLSIILNNKQVNIFSLLTNSFTILSNIFFIFLFINLIKLPITFINNRYIQIPFLFLEITSGIINLNKYSNNIILNIFIIILLISTNGLTICLQSINEIKKVSNNRYFINIFFTSKCYQLLLNILLFVIFFI